MSCAVGMKDTKSRNDGTDTHERAQITTIKAARTNRPIQEKSKFVVAITNTNATISKGMENQNTDKPNSVQII